MAEQELHVDDEGKVIPPETDENDDAESGGGAVAVESSEPEDARLATEDETPDVDPEREAIRQRRREERKHKKDAVRERTETLQRELSSRDAVINQLTERLSVIERKSSGMEVATLDNHLKQASDAYTHFKNQIAVSSAAGDHVSIADATEKMMLARDRYNQLDNVKKAYQQRQQQPAPLDPRMAAQAQSWLERNNWYDPDMKNSDSKIAKTVDEDLAAEGWNPTTPEYWEELDGRLKKYLPHRYKSGYNGAQSRSRSIVAGSGRESSGTQSSGSYRLSADRVAAIKEAGVEVGTPEFTRMVNSFKAYDKQQSAANR